MRNKPLVHPAIQARFDFFEQLECDIKKASIGMDLRLLYEKFATYCANLEVATSFGFVKRTDNACDENFRKELLTNVDMARNVCMSKRDNLSSHPTFNINNTNQQEQSQNLSLQLKEDLRRSLTGEQYDELKALIEEKTDKKTIAEKIKDFGIDVVSGVLAGIISSQMLK